MKKICLLLAVFSFLSVMPSFGLKLITNNEADRTVPSRCSGDGVEEYIEQNYTDNNDYYRQRHWYQGVRFDKYYKPVLSGDIRRELIGTTWYYPAYTPQNSQVQQTSKESEKLSKSYIREAADYYFVDTIAAPKKTVPVGY